MPGSPGGRLLGAAAGVSTGVAVAISPQLAWAAVAVTIVLVLLTVARPSITVSAATIVSATWGLLVAVRGLVGRDELASQSPASVALLAESLVILSAAAVTLYMWRLPIVRHAVRSSAITPLLAWSLLSTTWAVDPIYAAVSYARFSSAVILPMAYLALGGTARRLYDVALLAVSPYLVAPIFAYATGNIFVAAGRPVGAWLHPGLGSIVAAGTFLLSVGLVSARSARGLRPGPRPVLYVACAAASAIDILILGGKTGAAIALLGSAFLATSVWARGVGSKIKMAGFALAGFPALYWLYSELSRDGIGLSSHIEIYAQLGRAVTLMSRVELWTQLWESLVTQGIDRLLFGRGFTSLWRDPVVVDGWSSGHAHNVFINFLVETGVAGVALALFAIVRISMKAARAYAHADDLLLVTTAVVAFSLLTAAQADNVFGSVLSPPSYMFFAAVAVLSRYSTTKAARYERHRSRVPFSPPHDEWRI